MVSAYQLFGERIHLLLQFSVTLFVNLELRDSWFNLVRF